ncbi:hypothetical protein [Micromonospora sp. NPDC005197]|uniref:hypothetical protein n=1 Tax=Micromonospora sp. NPDC005197 TaxID=3157020 RepID=UPI0033AA4A44
MEQERQAARARKDRRKRARSEAFGRWEAAYVEALRIDAERAHTRDRLSKGAMISPDTLRSLGIPVPAGYVYESAEQPPPPTAPPAPPLDLPPGTWSKPCRHCGTQFVALGSKRFCSPACRVAARPVLPKVDGAARDRPHRTLRGAA